MTTDCLPRYPTTSSLSLDVVLRWPRIIVTGLLESDLLFIGIEATSAGYSPRGFRVELTEASTDSI